MPSTDGMICVRVSETVVAFELVPFAVTVSFPSSCEGNIVQFGAARLYSIAFATA